MPTAIATLEEFGAAIPVDDIGRVDTDELQRKLDAAATQCQRYTSRLFEPDPPMATDGSDTLAPVTRHFAARGRTTIRIPDLRVVTAVTLDGVALSPNVSYQLDVLGGHTATMIKLIVGFAFIGAFSAGDLAITGRWGMLDCPQDIKDSVLELAARNWRKRDARWSDQMVAGHGQFTYFRGVLFDILAIWDLYRVPNLAVV